MREVEAGKTGAQRHRAENRQAPQNRYQSNRLEHHAGSQTLEYDSRSVLLGSLAVMPVSRIVLHQPPTYNLLRS